MRILAIETSCDDTGVAILEVAEATLRAPTPQRFKVLSNVVSSQAIHQNYGGVFPMMASREHQKNLVSVLTQALKESKLLKIQNAMPTGRQANLKSQNESVKFKSIERILEREKELLKRLLPFLQKFEKPEADMIAVTKGPGLEPCLWVGVNFARVLSYFWGIPIVPVNHIEGHILVNFLPKIDESPKSKVKSIKFPAIALIVSGGHTQLILMKKIGKYKIIGETRDDAAGECFDKCAKLLGLGYPGGPEIARIAEQCKKQGTRNNNQTKLPRPMMHTKDYDFSFSGLKTAVLYKVRDIKNSSIDSSMELNKDFVSEMCVEIQRAILDVLIKKTIQAAKDFKVKTIILGGGVSANKELRRQMGEALKKENPNINYIIPDAKLSTDNALMIAVAGFFNRKKKASWKNLEANANLRVEE